MSTNKKHLIPIFVIIVTLYLYSIIINDGVLIFYGDSYEQVLQFYAGMWTKFHNGNIGFWDWYLGFGANSFTTMYYCNLNNIYFYVSLLFPKSFLPQLLTIYPLLKLLLTYITSFYWLRKINRSFYSSIIGSLIITFSGWVMALFNYNIFLDTYPMYFLTLYLFEDYLLNKKPFFTVLSISLIIITNFYNGYMFLPFFLAYSVYRYYLVVENPLLIDTIKFSLKIMLLILVAVAISGVVLIPSIYIVLQTPRLDENSIFHFINLSTLFRFLSSMYIPVSYKLNPNLFINLNQYNGIGWSGGTSLFSLVIGVTIIPLLPYISSKKNRKALICLFVLFFIILCVPTLYKLLQGTEETRWFFMFSILVSLAITSIIEDIITGSITNKILVRSYLLSVLIFFSILFISLTKGWYFDKSDLALFTLSFLVLSSLYTFFLSKKAKTTIIVIIVVEVLFNMINLLRFDPPKNSNDININQLSEVVEYIQNKDSSYYRIYFSESSRQVANSPYAYNYMASSFYSSLYNFEQLDYLRRYTGSWIANQADGRIYNYNIESYKYWIGYEYETAPYGYKFIDKFYDYMIYENQYYQGLGFMSNETLNEESVIHLPFFKQDQLLQKYIITADSNIQYNEKMLDNNVVKIAEYVPHEYFEYKLNNSNQGTMIYIENFAMENVYVEFHHNGKLVFNDYSVQQNYVGTYCPPNIIFDKIVIFIDDKYGYDSGINVYYSQNFDIFDITFKKNEANTLYDTIIDKDKVYTKIDVSDELSNGVLFTSIAFDSGWKAYVDNEITEIIKVNFGFVGLKLTPGHHEIEFIYKSPYFEYGCALSLIGLLSLIYISKSRYFK